MGNMHSVELFAEQDSVSQPGTKAITSASLDHLDPPVSAIEVIDEFVGLIKYPVDPMTEAVLKAVDVVDKSADEFTVKVFLDGKKLDEYGHGRGDGMDRCKIWKHCIIDRSKLTVKTIDYVDDATMGAWADEVSDENVHCTCLLQVLSDPTRMELHVDDARGNRLAMEVVRDALYNWTDQIVDGVQQAKTAKVKVLPAAASLKDEGLKSNVSEPMDAHISYDKFFSSFVDIIKENLEKNPSNTITDISESEFSSEGKVGQEDNQKEIKTAVKFSREQGEIEMAFVQDGKLARTTYYKLHKSPLVVEGWSVESDGTRLCGEATARQMQKSVNGAIAKATSWF